MEQVVLFSSMLVPTSILKCHHYEYNGLNCLSFKSHKKGTLISHRCQHDNLAIGVTISWLSIVVYVIMAITRAASLTGAATIASVTVTFKVLRAWFLRAIVGRSRGRVILYVIPIVTNTGLSQDIKPIALTLAPTMLMSTMFGGVVVVGVHGIFATRSGTFLFVASSYILTASYLYCLPSGWFVE